MAAKKSSRQKSSSKKSAGRKSAGKKKTGRKQAARRELIAPKGDKRFVRRGAKGEFKESDDVGRSLGQDVKRRSKKKARAGQGDRGDRAR